MIDGDVNAGAWSCGLVASLIHDIPTCDELVSRIVKEAEDIIRGRLLGFIKWIIIYLSLIFDRDSIFKIF